MQIWHSGAKVEAEWIQLSCMGSQKVIEDEMFGAGVSNQHASCIMMRVRYHSFDETESGWKNQGGRRWSSSRISSGMYAFLQRNNRMIRQHVINCNITPNKGRKLLRAG